MASPTPSSSSGLSEYASNNLQSKRPGLPRLVLISHAHAPPLNPAPNLKFDVRSLLNPPKHIRDQYNGTSKRLQEWMETHEEFARRREEIRGAILRQMNETTERRDKQISESDQQQKDDAEDLADEQGDEENDVDSITVDDDASYPSPHGTQELRVGIFCAMGRHRSVAMVDSLAKVSWPDWQIEVVHRDLLKKRGQKADGRREKKRRGNRGSEFADDRFD